MPKTSNGTGYGEFTPNKLADYSKLLSCYVPLATNVLRKWDNLYQPQVHLIDINAGPGQYGDELTSEECWHRGSPLIAMDKLTEQKPDRTPILYKAWFIDERMENCRQLENVLKSYDNNPNGSYQVLCGKHEDLLSSLLPFQRRAALGLLYHDPNGFASWDCLSGISSDKAYRTIDFLIHYGAATPKRFKGRFGKDYVQPVDEAVASIAKQYWLVQEPIGHTQWTFLLGTNYEKMPAWKRLRFHSLASDQGKAILNKIAYSKEEYKQRLYSSNTPLFDARNEKDKSHE